MSGAPRPQHTAFIFGENMRQVHLTAEIDWHWRRIGESSAMLYRTPGGEVVKATTQVHHLHGARRDTRVYLAFDARSRPDWAREAEMLRSRGLVLLRGPEG